MSPLPSSLSQRLVRLYRRYPTATGIAGGCLAAGLAWLVTHDGSDKAAPPEKIGPLAKTQLQPHEEAPTHPEQTMRPEVAAVLGFDGNPLPVEARIRELLQLKEALTGDEITELLRALLGTPPNGESAAGAATWFNEIANLLHRQEPTPAATFAEVLGTVVADARRPLVIRDYALQHLRRVWDENGKDARLRKSIEASFLEVAQAPGELQATALLGLHRLDPQGRQGVASAEVSRVAGEVLNGSGDLNLKMTAARIAGERQLATLRGPLLTAASSESEHALLRMAAVAALGRLGDPADRAALAALQPTDPRVAGAIRHLLAAGGP